MGERRHELELLARAGQLLLEYNESTGAIHRTLAATSRAMTGTECEVVVAYGGVAVSLPGESIEHGSVREFRYNNALLARVHAILADLREHRLTAEAALEELNRAESSIRPHPRLLAVLVLGVAASALAALLGADLGGLLVAGFTSGLGLAARQSLGRRHFSLLTLPFVAALIGAVLGGLAIRWNWTHSPALVLIVPSLMLVPGPHLINGLLDLIDNYVPMSVARLSLATSILFASAAGIIFGMELLFSELPAAGQDTTNRLNVFSDMLLAGIVTIGFAVFYNTSWSHIGMATIGGMLGHGARYVALQTGWPLEAATLVGGFVVGAVSAWIAHRNKAPFAVVAFAGAVTMMPGMQIYRAIGGALQLARFQRAAELPTVAGTLGYAMQATFVVLGLAIGLIVAGRAVFWLIRVSEKTSH